MAEELLPEAWNQISKKIGISSSKYQVKQRKQQPEYDDTKYLT